jgi:hypothetical protein
MLLNILSLTRVERVPPLCSVNKERIFHFSFKLSVENIQYTYYKNHKNRQHTDLEFHYEIRQVCPKKKRFRWVT